MEIEQTVSIDEPISDVYASFVDFKNFRWRHEVKDVKKLDDKHYIEYARKNYPTFYTVSKKKKDTYYELQISNNWLEGTIEYNFEKVESSTNVSIKVNVEFIDSKPLFVSKRSFKRFFKKYIEDIKKLGM